MVKCNENKFLTGKQVTDVVYKYFTILLYYSLKIIVVTKNENKNYSLAGPVFPLQLHITVGK